MCEPQKIIHSDDTAVYYDYFVINGHAVGATSCCYFVHENTHFTFPCKILTVFKTKDTEELKAEVLPLPYQNKTVNNSSNKFLEVVQQHQTMEIFADQLLTDEKIKFLFVPLSIKNDNVVSYVEQHKNDKYFATDEDGFSDDEDLNADSQIIIYRSDENGDEAVPIEVLELYLSYFSESPLCWYEHDLLMLLNNTFLHELCENFFPSANKLYVFQAMANDNDFKLEKYENDTDRVYIFFRRKEHVVTTRQLEHLNKFKALVQKLKNHLEQAPEENIVFMKELYREFSNLKSHFEKTFVY